MAGPSRPAWPTPRGRAASGDATRPRGHEMAPRRREASRRRPLRGAVHRRGKAGTQGPEELSLRQTTPPPARAAALAPARPR